MSPDGEPTVVGYVRVEFLSDGNASLDVQGVSYIQLYGTAGVLNEMAREQQVEMKMAAMMDPTKKKIVLADHLPRQ